MLWSTPFVDHIIPGPDEDALGILERVRRAATAHVGWASWPPYCVGELAPVVHYQITIRTIRAILGDYAVMDLASRRLEAGGLVQGPWIDEAWAFVLRPPAGSHGRTVEVGAVYSLRVHGLVADDLYPRVVLGINRGPAEPIAPEHETKYAALLLRMWRECVDVPVGTAAPAPQAQRWDGRADRGWILRLPTDNTARVRGMLNVLTLTGWQVDAGCVLAYVDDGSPEPMDVYLTAPAVLGWSGPWARTDNFMGDTSRYMASTSGLVTVWPRQPRGTPELTLDLRLNHWT
jgi:hypothetical protein